MTIKVNEENLKEGLLALVVALVEIITDALKLQALRRMEGGSLTAEECERLGLALKEIEGALEKIKSEQRIGESIRSIRDDLDRIADSALDDLINPQKWLQEARR